MINNIRKIRKQRKMTLSELSKRIEKTVSCISNYEQGIRKVDLETAAKIAAALNCTVDDLLEKENAS